MVHQVKKAGETMWSLRTFYFSSFICMLAFVGACATVPSEDQALSKLSRKQKPLLIGSGQIGSQGEEGVVNFTGEAIAPAGTLLVSRVSRNRSEMREGPGVNFAVTDRILEKNARVVVFERHGVWTKVLSLGYWDSGWVHSDTITSPKPNKNAIAINVRKFPTVLAVRPVTQAFAFADHVPVQFNEAIPKGKLFRALQVADDKTLIWNFEKNEMIWIKGKDMQ